MFKEDLLAVKKLHTDGHLHWRIVWRVSILLLYSIVFLGIASYHFFADTLNFFIASGLYSIGFLLGFFLVSKMFRIHWDKERALVIASGMNFFGFFILLLYAALRYWSNNVVDYLLHPDAARVPGLTFCFVAGIMLGRFFYTVIAIRRVHSDSWVTHKYKIDNI
ncbi:MAG: hypothetical protein MUD00_01125 [Candidatus Pacebacteria bacterium]|jgi:hypothetical protein|nr:hypothetical protein [Candidatus Paceibacterota bacterium]